MDNMLGTAINLLALNFYNKIHRNFMSNICRSVASYVSIKLYGSCLRDIKNNSNINITLGLVDIISRKMLAIAVVASASC